MMAKNLIMGAVGALTLTLALSFVSAQNSEAPSTLASDIANLQSEVDTLTGPEKIERATEIVNGMKSTLTGTNEVLERVRTEEQDILKLNCLNEKVAAIKGFVKVGEKSHEELKSAVSAGDKEAEKHHYTLVAIGGEKVGELGEQALVCAGEVLRFSEDTVVDRTIDPNIAEVDPIIIDDSEFDFDLAMERLPELTAFN